MAERLDIIGWNQLMAIVAGGVVWLICRTRLLRRRPAACHGLWMLVLLKIATPPILPLPMFPSMAAEEAGRVSAPASGSLSAEHVEPTFVASADPATPASASEPFAAACGMTAASNPPSAGRAAETAPAATATRDARHLSWRSWRANGFVLIGISLLVTFVLWMAAARQCFRLNRLLQGPAAEPARASELVRETSRLFHLPSPPALQIVDARVSPMLWFARGKPTILLPRPLVDSLNDDGLRCIIAHELAHLVRRDHWTNLLAFGIASLFWWNPLAWFARRELSATAEVCSDALALERLKNLRRSYCETLLAVVDSLTRTATSRSALGIAFVESHTLRRRFEMIVDEKVTARVTCGRWILPALGIVFLALAPARAKENPDDIARAGEDGSLIVAASPAQLGCPIATSDNRGAPADAKPDIDRDAVDHDSRPATATHEVHDLRTIHLDGTVFGPGSNRPLGGARLYLNVDEWNDPIELGVSDDDGSYHFEVSEAQLRRVVAPAFMLMKQRASLIAVAEGLGPAWAELPSVTGERMGEMHHQYHRDLQLAADLPIAGRVVDVAGRPVAGATVAVSRLYDLSDPDWYKMHRAIRANDPDLMDRKQIDPTGWFTPLYRTAWTVIPPVITDPEGRFRIAGVGRDRAVVLQVTGPGIRNTQCSVLTRDDVVEFTHAVRTKYPRTPDLDGYFYPRRKDESTGEPGVPLFGPSPTITADPARTISGVVRDGETGEPIGGVQVYVHSVVSPARATTDRLGRYHIQRSEAKTSISLYTRYDSQRYLDVVQRLTDTRGLGGEIRADIELPRGVAVTGRVIDAVTKRPIVSAPQGSCHVPWPGPLQTGSVVYYPLASNSALRGSPMGLYFEGIQPGKANYWTSAEIDPDGRFRIAVPSGPGVLLVRSNPGMPFDSELIGVWKESQGFHCLFPYVRLTSRARDDGAPGEYLHSFPGLTGPIPLDGNRRYHAYRVINPPADGAKSMDLTITVPRGETRTLRFVKPDGRPIRRAKVHGLVAPPQNMTIEIDDSDAEVFALEPGKPREITAMSVDGKYAGRAFVSTSDPPRLSIALEPTADE